MNWSILHQMLKYGIFICNIKSYFRAKGNFNSNTENRKDKFVVFRQVTCKQVTGWGRVTLVGLIIIV